MAQVSDWRERAADAAVQVAREASTSRLTFDAAACRVAFLAILSASEVFASASGATTASAGDEHSEQDRLAAEIAGFANPRRVVA